MSVLRRLVPVIATIGALVGLPAVMAVSANASDTTPTASTERLRVVTTNLAFRGERGVGRDWRKIRPYADVVFFQEAKNVVLRDVLGDGWKLRQNTTSDDRQGSAVAIRRSVMRKFGDFELVKGTDAHPCRIMTRWIGKANFQLNNGRWLRVASLHMPPPRCQTGPGGPYATMADKTVAFAKRTDRLTVLGADWNKIVDDDPNLIGHRTGLRPRGPDRPPNRIDGFYVSRGITTCCLRYLEPTGSDHVPVQLKVGVPAP